MWQYAVCGGGCGKMQSYIIDNTRLNTVLLSVKGLLYIVCWVVGGVTSVGGVANIRQSGMIS